MAANTKKIIVIDASALLSLLFADEKHALELKKIFKQFAQNKLDFIAPHLLKFEIGNALKSAVLKKRATASLANKILLKFTQLPIIYSNINLKKNLEIALKHNLSFYDACYLQLARSKNLKLITLDNQLKKLA